MKIKIVICICVLFGQTCFAQTTQTFQFKSDFIYGSILKHTKHLNALVKGPVVGGEMAFEWQTMGGKTWQQYLNFPTIGVGAVFLNLGNTEKLGNAYAIYPYIDIPLLKNKFFKLYVKGGMGASYLNKTYYNTNTNLMGLSIPFDSTNAAIGSHLNIYFAGGGGVEIPIAKGFKFTTEYTWNHVSNGSAVAPNSGINMVNGIIGLKYFPNFKDFNAPLKQNIGDVSKKIKIELIFAGGFRQLYYQDNKTFPTASLVLGAYKPITNFYRMGFALDAFYDGVYGEVNGAANPLDNETNYVFTYVNSDLFKNKLRVGVSWQHELMLGRMTAGFHFGLYLYNPIKNLEPYTAAISTILNKPLIYPYNIEKENGWLYTRAALKYTVSEHYFISLGLKTHLQKAEFIEWGLGYKF